MDGLGGLLHAVWRAVADDKDDTNSMLAVSGTSAEVDQVETEIPR